MNKMDGRNIIGISKTGTADGVMNVFGPGLQRVLEGSFSIATDEEIDKAMNLAATAFETYKNISGARRAAFLNAIADKILALDDALVQRAMQESGLPEGRIKGERGRTIGQLRLFAKAAAAGSWVEASIDLAIPDRQPLPKSDIRRMLRPLGPVVVFTASNFPLAFSTAGGDTAAALASGCPVIVKAHESHLGTNSLVALAIQQAAEQTGMPDGVFSSLNGTGIDLGQKLASHPAAKAIAFTGSFKAGKAIFDTAAKRKEPIPVFAEMGSINPVLLLDEALRNRGTEIADQYAGSVTLGAGQFCTNPGLLIGKTGEAMNQFIAQLGISMSNKTPQVMLNEGICNNFEKNKNLLLEQAGVSLLAQSDQAAEGFQGRPAVATISGAGFMDNPVLKEEVFGPFTLVVQCADDDEMLKVVENLNGQLTGTVMGESTEIIAKRNLVEALENKVGRMILNGVPTGVEVCHSMHHGGPYPATTDARFTSVGTDAIKRFGRPVAYQDYLQDLLPDELKDGNPLGIWRTVDGEFRKE
ncbi:MAG: alpha-ketoglutaric semialdehyde dehydrogenase [Saprospiraceae bacterium]|jgi:alpha-ketoglutaric semialdehyde dehydrogenase